MCRKRGDAAVTLIGITSSRYFAAGECRPARIVSSRSHAQSSARGSPGCSLHCQFPSVVAGRFIRAPLPRPRRSCTGMIATGASVWKAQSIKSCEIVPVSGSFPRIDVIRSRSSS